MKKNKSRQRVSSSRNSLNRRASPQQKKPSRKPRVLWFNSYCLLDTSSGASISARQILKQLAASGYEVKAVGATIFDDPKGAAHLEGTLGDAISRKLETCSISDGDLSHYLLVTKSPTRENITFSELNNLYSLYASALNTFKPDLVFFYGGTSFDLHIPAEARVRCIPSAAYLVNSNYLDSRWCRDVDLIVTDTQATSDFYRVRQGFVPVPVGKFIDLGKVIAPDHKRHYATLINPSWAKGAGIVAMLAVLLEERRPDIVFEVVESRGSWSEVVRNVTRSVWGIERSELKNVIVTPNTDNISEVYGRSRIVLGLSQWWESGSRVLAEAMLNGIPAMVSNHGGSPEMVGEGGIVVDLPPSCHEAPYNSMPRPELLGELVQFLERVWDDEPFYLNLMVRALQQGNKLHRMEVSTQRLLKAFQPLVEKRAGDGDFSDAVKKVHKHGLEERGPSSLVKENNASEQKSPALELQVNPGNEIKSFLEVDASVKPNQIKMSSHKNNLRCVNLIHPGGNWILEKMAGVLEEGLENAQSFDCREINGVGKSSPLHNPHAINYYIHYNLFSEKSAGIDVAWFTHIEENIPTLRKKFFDVASVVDFAIFNSPKYKIASGLPDEKSAVILPGIDDHFFSRKLVLGVIGRDYSYTDRKNTKLLEEIRKLPFVDVRFTGGALVDEDLVKFYREIDYVFTASTIEGGPMSLLEGLAAGKKSIFPRDVGLWSEFEDMVISYDHEDLDGLLEILESLYIEKTKLVSRVENCTWEQFVFQHNKIFARLSELL